MDDKQITLIQGIAKLDTVIDNLTVVARQTKSLRQKAKVADALRGAVAIREALKTELAKTTPE